MLKISRKFRRIALIALVVLLIPGGFLVAADVVGMAKRMFLDNGQYNDRMPLSTATRADMEECFFHAVPIQFNFSDKPPPRDYFVITEEKKRKVMKCMHDKGYEDMDFSACKAAFSPPPASFDQSYRGVEDAYAELAAAKSMIREQREKFRNGDFSGVSGDARLPLRTLPSAASATAYEHVPALDSEQGAIAAPQVEVFKFNRK